MLYEFHAFSFSISMLFKKHHVMEITIGHSHHTSYVNLLVQKCMFEHKYDMDCKQARFTLIELKTYIHMYNQAYSSNQKKRHKLFQIFCKWQECKIALFAWVPHMGSIIEHHSTRHIPIDLLRVLNRVASKGLVNKSASWSLVPTCSSTMHLFSTSSLMKWWRMSICLVLECWTGFLEILIALMLSQKRVRVPWLNP